MRVWIVSNLPPPVHGVSIFNEMLLAELRRADVPYEFVRVGSRDSNSQLGFFEVRKFVRDLVTLLNLSLRLARDRSAATEDQVLYFTPSQSGPGICRDLVVSFLGRAFAKRVIAHIHGCGWLDFHRRGNLSSRAMLQVLRNCDAVICLGGRFTAQMVSATGLRCVCVNNGVASVATSQAKELPRSPDPVRFLFLSNFIASKGLTAAANTVRRLRSAGRDVRLTCAGSWRAGEDRATFELEFRREMDDGTIAVIGPVTGLAKRQALEHAHFMLLPTRYPYEGQPLVIIEAMSHGVVPLTTDQGGIPDLLGPELSDRLARPEFDSPDSLAAAAGGLLDSRSSYHHLSTLCLARQRDSLSFRRCASEIIRVLEGTEGSADGPKEIGIQTVSEDQLDLDHVRS